MQFFLNDQKRGRGVAIYDVSSLAWPPPYTCSSVTSPNESNTPVTCHSWRSGRNHQTNILLLSSPSWCPAPSVLVWHILPHCPLERSGSSYLLLQICRVFFPSSWSSFVIHLFLPNPRSTMKSLQIASVNPNSPEYQTSLISSGFPFLFFFRITKQCQLWIFNRPSSQVPRKWSFCLSVAPNFLSH